MITNCIECGQPHQIIRGEVIQITSILDDTTTCHIWFTCDNCGRMNALKLIDATIETLTNPNQ